jgi:hypothetical protein
LITSRPPGASSTLALLSPCSTAERAMLLRVSELNDFEWSIPLAGLPSIDFAKYGDQWIGLVAQYLTDNAGISGYTTSGDAGATAVLMRTRGDSFSSGLLIVLSDTRKVSFFVMSHSGAENEVAMWTEQHNGHSTRLTKRIVMIYGQSCRRITNLQLIHPFASLIASLIASLSTELWLSRRTSITNLLLHDPRCTSGSHPYHS